MQWTWVCIGAVAGYFVAHILHQYGLEKAAKEVVEAIQKMGSQAVAVKADVAKKVEAEALVKATVDHFGGIDILVNNAGFTRPAMMTKMTEQQWDEVVDLHLKGAFLCTQAAAQHRSRRTEEKSSTLPQWPGWSGP